MEFSKKDILGVVFLVLSIVIAISLFTFSSFDPSFNTDTAGVAVHNSFGLLGSYSSDILLQLFGLSSFILPVALFLGAIFVFYRSKKKGFSYWRAIGFVFLLMFLSTFLCAVSGMVTYGGAQFPTGGFIGKNLCALFNPYISSAGTAIVSLSITLVLLFYIGNFSFSSGMATFVVVLYRVIVIPSKLFYKALSWFAAWLVGKLNKKDLPDETLIQQMEKKEISLRDKIKKKMPEVKEDLPDETLIQQMEKKEISLRDKIKKKMPEVKEELVTSIEDEDDGFATTVRKGNTKYRLPSVELLNKVQKTKTKDNIAELEAVAASLQARLKDFDVDGQMVEVSPGPVITMYEFKPAPGVKINKVANLSDDLALALGCGSLRVIAPIPGKSVIGIEVPNKNRETVYIRELIDSNLFKTSEKKIPLAIGKDTIGNPYVTDLSNMPHLLVAGTTGSGKSVFINSIICSILYKFSPEQVRMLMVDPKMLELSVYDGIPHLLHPVITDAQKASRALKWAVKTMMERYALISSKGAKSITSYNAVADEPMPYIVIIVDELADLMMVSSKDVESSLTRLAQMARAAGIHIVLATQRPSVDVITGLIKANFPARISFQVSSRIDSRTVLDGMGAEKLLGAGDMLFIPPGTGRLERFHGAFVTDDEVKKVVDFVKQQGVPNYEIESLEEEEVNSEMADGEYDTLYDEAVKIVVETRKPTISYIQRRLKIGYNRAARIIETMEKNGIVSSALATGQREVLIDQR
jgi:S-DNA-T family DNA segregation ATPase FtsK/SpoIIIE